MFVLGGGLLVCYVCCLRWFDVYWCSCVLLVVWFEFGLSWFALCDLLGWCLRFGLFGLLVVCF